MNRLVGPVSVCAIALGAGASAATLDVFLATITPSSSPPGSAAPIGPITSWNPALGRLNSIEVISDAIFSGRARLVALDLGPGRPGGTTTVSFGVGAVLGLGYFDAAGFATVAGGTFFADFVQTASIAPGAAISIGQEFAFAGSGRNIVTYPADNSNYARFLSAPIFNGYASHRGDSQIYSNSNPTIVASPDLRSLTYRMDVSLRFHYTPNQIVPLPSAGLTGSIGILLVALRRRRPAT